MTSITRLWEQIEVWFQAHTPEALAYYHSGASEELLQQIEALVQGCCKVHEPLSGAQASQGFVELIIKSSLRPRQVRSTMSKGTYCQRHYPSISV